MAVVLFGSEMACATELVTAVSQTDLMITSAFDGQSVTLFGTVDVGPSSPLPYHVVVRVTGPVEDQIVLKKSSPFGFWVTTERTLYSAFPSFFSVLSDEDISLIADQGLIGELGLSPLKLAQSAPDASTASARALVRLMQEDRSLRIDGAGVRFLSPALFSTTINLPSTAVPGRYDITTILFHGGRPAATRSDNFWLRAAGVEQFLKTAAKTQPALYGLITVACGLVVGWLGGMIFKR